MDLVWAHPDTMSSCFVHTNKALTYQDMSSLFEVTVDKEELYLYNFFQDVLRIFEGEICICMQSD